jgi:hypothetical protein
MFKVKWVLRRQETNPVASETIELESLHVLVTLCQTRLPTMRLRYPETPPDGFIVADSGENEVRRWFDRPQTP